MKNNIEYAFLLGGYDLEMVCIRDILIQYKNAPAAVFSIDFLDHHLQWGAQLSHYAAELPGIASKYIVGVELGEDIPLPPGYIAIDHHGEKSASACFRKSEQVESFWVAYFRACHALIDKQH
ncbi:MAG: hypothetical protein WCO44_15985 [Bacteroidota bacterium]